MYKIGEFSKITSLTIKALRYYEEQGILCPSERDKNGYRLYNDQDYERARLIALLRDWISPLWRSGMLFPIMGEKRICPIS